MGKKDVGKKKDAQQKAKRQLARAKLKLQIAEEKHIQARARGKQEVEEARLRAARWVAKAAQAVEQRADAMARAEVRWQEVRGGKGQTETPAPSSTGPVPADGGGVSPEAAAETLERVESEQTAVETPGGIVLPDGVDPDGAADVIWQG